MFYLAIVLAGGLGSLLRYSVSRLAVNLLPTGLPFATLFVNVAGSFLIGFLSWSVIQKWHLPKELQTVVLVGFLGGFTTFSTFSLEIVSFVEQGLIGRAILWVLGNVFLSIVMCAAGLLLARHI